MSRVKDVWYALIPADVIPTNGEHVASLFDVVQFVEVNPGRCAPLRFVSRRIGR